MKNTHTKRIIVALVSISLLLTTAFLSGCDDGQNYEKEIASLQAQIDELKKDYEKLSAEHKEILDQLEGRDTLDSDETTATDSEDTGSTTVTTTATTASRSKNNNGTTAKPAATTTKSTTTTTKSTTTTTQSTTTTTTKKPDDDGFGTEVGM